MTITTMNKTGAQGEALRQLIDRIERLEEEKANISEDIKEVYSEAKALGYDAKIIRKVIKERKTDEQTRTEQQMVFDIYWDVVQSGEQRFAAE